MLHEGAMPESIVFTEPLVEETETKNVLRLGTPLGFPVGWVERLATAVWLAPENDGLWKDESVRREEARDELGELKHDVSFSRRPNQQSKKMKQKNERMEWTHNDTTYRLSYPSSAQQSQLAEALEERAQSLRATT